MHKMTKLSTVLLILCIPIIVRADGEKTRQVKLPLSRMIDLANSLSALEGTYRDVVKDGAAEKELQRPYKLGALRIAIGRNLAAIKPILEGYGKAQQEILSDCCGGVSPKPSSDETAVFQRAVGKLMQAEYSANLYILGEAELNVGDPPKNPFPSTVLSGLDPIMDWVK